MIQEKQVIVNNLLVNYYGLASDDPAAETVVFLHGWLVNAEIWRSTIEGLHAQKDCNIYALDLPGFGKSQALEDDFDLEGYTQVVKGFIEKLNLKGVVLVGHSFGGRIAIKLSAQSPDLIRKLVLADSAGFRDKSFRKRTIVFLSKFFRPLLYLPFLKLLRPKFYKVIGSDYLNTNIDLRATFLKIVNEDLTEYLPKISAPTLIIWGDKDRDTPMWFAKKINSLVRNSRLEILKGAEHISFIDKPEEFNKALIDFIFPTNRYV